MYVATPRIHEVLGVEDDTGGLQSMCITMLLHENMHLLDSQVKTRSPDKQPWYTRDL